MQKPETKFYTPEEYLYLEENADYKSEYYQGEIFGMSGASANHNRIVGDIHSKLNTSLANSKCEAFMSDMKIWIDKKELFTYPDTVVVCGEPEFYPERDDTITNPLIIIEVLSESTKNYDRGEKFEFYRSIPTFQEYILIDQYKIHIEQFYIGNEGQWVLREYNDKNDVLEFTKIDCQSPVQDIYRRVDFR